MELSAIPLDQALSLVAILLAGGFVTGILAGLFGIGGGAIVVPILFEVFAAAGVDPAVRMHLSVGTSLAIIVPTALRSYSAHKARSAVRSDVLRRWAIPLLLGAIVGGLLATVSPERVLKIAFVAFAGLMAIRLLFGRDSWALGNDLPGPVPMSAYGFGIGFISPLVGISGGGVSSVVLALYRVPIHQAIATSAGLGALIAVPGVIAYVIGGLSHLAELPPLSLGFVSLPGVLLVGGVATLSAPLGARLAHAFTKRQLEVGFGLYLLAVGARFVVALVA